MQKIIVISFSVVFGLLLFTTPLEAKAWQMGEVYEVKLSELKPTQPVVAHDQIAYKLARYQQQPASLFSELCEVNGLGKLVSFDSASEARDDKSYTCEYKTPTSKSLAAIKTAVLGPENQLYLTDGHHTLTGFYEMPGGGADFKVKVRLQKIYQSTDLAQFWRQTEEDGNSWLYDADGQSLPYQEMPQQLMLSQLQNDPYRAAMYFMRGSLWQKPKPAIPFVEFYWAQHLRKSKTLAFPGYHSATEYSMWLERISQYLVGLTPETKILNGLTASALGLKHNSAVVEPTEWLCERLGQGVSLSKLGMALQQRGMPVACDNRQYLGRHALSTGLSELPDAKNPDGSVNVLIEIPAGTSAKWQQDKNQPLQLEWEFQHNQPRVVSYLPYPANYGIITNTLFSKADGGDGDPLDVFLLGDSLSRGIVYPARLIGVIQMTDNGERDDKLLAVPLSGVFSEIRDIKSLEVNYPNAIEIIEIWLQNYKGKDSRIEILKIVESNAANSLVQGID